jgi:small-conductance mechanosensitive channel
MVFADDMKPAFDNDEEAEAAFTMFDKDLNGDISMEELEAVCVEIGRERKSITASLKDLDSVVSKLDAILMFIVAIIVVIVFITLISTSAAGVLTSLGGSVLALSWLFSATAQEFLQSIIFVFVKHPFDVGDRVTIYGNSGSEMKGDDYFVKEISLLYTEFKKMEGHIVQAPNSYLNTLFILNMRRTGGLAEAVPLVVKFGTTLDQIEELRARLLEFVRAEKREYQGNILTEVRQITEAYSVSLNVVFFYKSNWQNELLRLQRRNKFICALMTFMQEIGIEGPLMRLPGQKQHTPFYVNYPGQGPVQSGDGVNPQGDHSGREQPLRPHHSILRQRSQMSRARGESVSSMAKRVDFSLGMKSVANSNLIGDVHEENNQARVPDITRTSASRGRPEPIDEGSEHASVGKSSAREEHSMHHRFAQPRESTESHSNRFFGHNKSKGEEHMMEGGLAAPTERIDPRSGVVSPQAVRTTSNAGEGASHWRGGGRGYSPLRGEEDFEMKPFGNDK